MRLTTNGLESPITDNFYKKYEGTQPNWGFNGLGYITYKRTYARKIGDRTEEWYETVRRCVEWLYEEQFKLDIELSKTYYQKLYDYVFTLKSNFSGRMLWQAGTDTVDRLGGASLSNCLHYDTEILTKNGIKRIGELSGTVQTVMDGAGTWVDAPINNYDKQKLMKVNLNRKGSTKTILATKNHRWIRHSYRDKSERHLYKNIETTTDALKTGDELLTIVGPSIKSIKYISPVGIMCGFVFGDGSKNHNLCNVRLCGKKDQEMLKYFNIFPYYNVEEDIQIHHLPGYFKNKPDITLDKTYLYGWIAGYFAADGCVSADGEIMLNSADKSNLEFVRSVCSLIGIATRPITYQMRKGFNDYETPLYKLGFIGSTLKEDFFLLSHHKSRFNKTSYRKMSNWKVVNVEYTNLEEDVYCAEVPTTHSFVLSDSLLTGNCFGFVCDCKESFLNTLDYLMLGGGVGYNIQKEHVDRLPWIKEKVSISHEKTKDAKYIVPDSREGWIDLLDNILTSFFETGKSFNYSTILIRPFGEPIAGFGGTASGPEPLIKGMGKIIDILHTREGKKLRPIDCLDIMNCLGELVVAGNVRRSAQLALGDVDDEEFLNAKNWELGDIPNHRAMSNNTIVSNSFQQLPDKFWEGYNGSGEPYGLLNMDLMRSKGRLVDFHRTDPDAIVVNPCAEISLSPTKNTGGAESCNLCEIYLNNIKSEEEFIDIAETMYYVVKTITMLPFHTPETERIIHTNSRLGIGITGIVQNRELTKKDVLSKVYKHLENVDERFSRDNDFPTSIKLTTVKPSGTLSLLAGATPGVHPGFSKNYIRRIRMASHDSLVDICKKAGYKVEFVKNFDGSDDIKTSVVEFPVKMETGTVLAENMSAVRQLKLHNHIQKYWADNNVSVTVYYKPEELPEIKEWLAENYDKGVKTVSFLLHSEHGFDQAPYEEISDKEYSELMTEITDLDYSKNVEEAMLEDSTECAGGHCPIR